MIREDRLLGLLKKLISIPSVNPSLVPGGGGEGEIARFIGAYLEDIGLLVRYQEIGDGRLNVVGILPGSGDGPSLMLNGHTDTVGYDGMSIDPLVPQVSGDRVYGRGSYDMKGGLCAMIEAVHSLVEEGRTLPGDVVLACVGDEEYASAGTEALVGEFRTDSAIVCEPTGLSVCVAHKGFAWVEVTCRGKAAHGSLPSEGVDAILGAAAFVVEADKHHRDVLTKRSHPLLGSPSIHASVIEGGTDLSTYPALCTLRLERRTIPGEDPDEIRREMEAIREAVVRQFPKIGVGVDVFFVRPPFSVSPEERIVRTVRDATTQVLGRKPELVGSSAWLDSAILHDAGIPTVVFGPDGDGAHSAVEWVDFPSVVSAAKVLRESVLSMTREGS